MLSRKITSEFVVLAARDDEFDFVVFAKLLKIVEIEGIGFAGIGTLHVDNFDDLLGQDGR